MGRLAVIWIAAAFAIVLSLSLFMGSGDEAPATIPAAVDPAPSASLEATLLEAAVAFNAPEQLTFREPSPIELVLAPVSTRIDPESLLSEGLPGETRTATGIDYALKMRATLSGPDFTIDPPGPQMRTVLENRPTRWDWTVTPTRFGRDRMLVVELHAILSQGGSDLPPLSIRTFREVVDVDVGLWDRVTSTTDEVTKVHAAIAAIGGTVVAVAGWLWARRRKPKPARPEPVEIIVRPGQPEPPDAQR
jgi:hypothetical protein